MNKQELVKKVAEALEVSQVEAKRVYETIVAVIQAEIVNPETDEIIVPGLAKFTKTAREAAVRKNPKTGEPVDVAAHTHLKATPVPALKTAVR